MEGEDRRLDREGDVKDKNSSTPAVPDTWVWARSSTLKVVTPVWLSWMKTRAMIPTRISADKERVDEEALFSSFWTFLGIRQF